MKGIQVILLRADNGWMVQARCLNLVFTDPAALAGELQRYIHAPDTVTKEYAQRYPNHPIPAPYFAPWLPPAILWGLNRGISELPLPQVPR